MTTMTFWELCERVRQLEEMGVEDNAQVTINIETDRDGAGNCYLEPLSYTAPVRAVELYRGGRHEVVVS